MFLRAVVVFLALAFAQAWTAVSKSARVRVSRGVTMEYIPDGLTKAQYAAIKKKEEDEMKGKDLGKIGITKFASRSFEAWQKSGAKNLFPVDPNAPESEKPYMQRKGGMADGSDLIKKGIKASELKGGAKAQAKNAADFKYAELEAKGLTRSSPFELPWSNAQTAKLATAKLSEEQKASQAKKKQAAAGSKAAAPAPVEPPKKKFFGLF